MASNAGESMNWRVKSDARESQQQPRDAQLFSSGQYQKQRVFMPSNRGSWNNGEQRSYGNTTYQRDNRSSGPPKHENWEQQGPIDKKLEAELFSEISSGINFDKYEGIPVEATGSDVPPPITHFADQNLHPWIMDNIRKCGYDRPTPVQKYSIPTLNDKRDLMSCAQTGSGKTAAFLVPVINRILEDGPSGVGKQGIYPLALVIAPTRELAIQIYNESRKFAYRTPIKSALLYGGKENYRDQLGKLRLGPHIVIATPGRLIDVLEKNIIHLDACRFLVLDEADRMLDMGFEPQIRQIVQSHGMPKRGQRVTAMFSATFPKEIQLLAQDFLEPEYVFLAVGRVGSASENILQKIVWVEEHTKQIFLMDLIDGNGREDLTLVFVETKRGASDLAYLLSREGYQVAAIHGDLKQSDRERYLDNFRAGMTPLLVATAVAARGLDIPNVKHDRKDRSCRNLGIATSFFTQKNQNIAKDLAALIVEANQELPKWLEDMAANAHRYGNKSNFNRRPGVAVERGRCRFGGGQTLYRNQGSNDFGSGGGNLFGRAGNGNSQASSVLVTSTSQCGSPSPVRTPKRQSVLEEQTCITQEEASRIPFTVDNSTAYLPSAVSNNGNSGGRAGKYVPPAQRDNHRLGDVPEGAPATNYSNAAMPGNGFNAQNRQIHGSNNQSGGMHKSQSFTGVQQPQQFGGNQCAPAGVDTRFPPPSLNRMNSAGSDYGQNQRGGRGGRGGYGGGYSGGDQNRFFKPAAYIGRQSYDQRNVHDEKQWANQSRGGKWNEDGHQQQQHHQQGGNQNTRWSRLEDAGQDRPTNWEHQGPADLTLESELFTGMNSGINFDKYEEIPVEATGTDCPPPITHFTELSLHPWIVENIKKSGYDRPTPVQKYSIPTLNSRRDLMSCAQTGSGKTAAFLVPVINRILEDGPAMVKKKTTGRDGRSCQYPLALIISPTRELSLQIYNESRKFAYRTPITSALLYGGRENYRDQINKLRLGAHILIATPGRLIDVLSNGFIGLEACRFLVLDEADRMLDMGFEPQIRQIVELNGMPPKGERVTAMFSATFPKEIQMLAQDF
uniref:RNA helicase n=1 Tax=Ditylenchus dipsaci TaxID=166011 RepID=A0A915EM88_9BILA